MNKKDKIIIGIYTFIGIILVTPLVALTHIFGIVYLTYNTIKYKFRFTALCRDIIRMFTKWFRTVMSIFKHFLNEAENMNCY